MEFLSIREFSAYPSKTRETLKKEGKIILTNNGKPSMLVFDITNQNFEELIDILNRAQAMRLLDEIQMQSVRGGLDSMNADEINTEIAAERRSRLKTKKSPQRRTKQKIG